MTFSCVLMKQKASELLGFMGNGGLVHDRDGRGHKPDLSNIHSISNETEDLFES